MGKKKAPPAPTPQSSYTYQDGVLTGQNVYDAGRQAYINSTFSSPAQKAFQDAGNQQIPQLLGKLQQAYNPSEAEQQQYFNDYVDPQLRDINKSFDQQTASANQGAIASGIGNSAGFSRFLANDVMGERAKTIADINRQGRLAQYDLGALRAKQYMPLLDLLTGRQDTGLQQANQLGQLNANYTQQGNNQALTRYQLQQINQKKGGGLAKTIGTLAGAGMGAVVGGPMGAQMGAQVGGAQGDFYGGLFGG
jgi:hypothetical protein